MPTLPLVLEQSARWYLFAVPLAGTMIFLVGQRLWSAWRAGWADMPPRALIVCIVLLVGAVWFLALPVGWQLRLDDKGVTLEAPLELWSDHGTIAWQDLDDIRFGSSGGRHPSPTVEFASAGGKVLAVGPLDSVPASYWPALVSVVEAHAPAFFFDPNGKGWIARAMANAQPREGTLTLLGYRAHDGAGRVFP